MKRYILLAALVLIPMCIYEKMDQDTIKSQEKEKESEKALTTLSEEIKDTENLSKQFQKNNTMQEQKDSLFFKPAFPALNLDTVFFILLIHTCGADLVQSISTLSQHMWLIGLLAELAFSFILAVYPTYKWKQLEKQREELEKQREELEKWREELEKEKDVQEKPREELENPREEMEKQREELEKQRQRLVEQLNENEREREANKKKLQSVETEITEREKKFDKPEELLRQKENLLQAQWKLDETKKIFEKQILDREKLLEATDNLLRSNRQGDV